MELPPLKAAALGHLHVHGADVVLAIVLTLPPQAAEAPERQAPRLSRQTPTIRAGAVRTTSACWVGAQYLDPSSGREDGVVGVLLVLLLEALGLGPDQQVEVRGQVAPQQGFVGGDVEQKGESLHVEARLQDLQRRRGGETTPRAYPRNQVSGSSGPAPPLTISPPWTPLPLRLGAYSARSTERSHSITL